ncbi:MAG: efflux RND transporter permease subunit [Polyangiales bacterium]
MTLSEVSIRRPVFTTMLAVASMVLGYIGFTRIPVDLYPDVEFPVVSITTVYPGASPREVESQVTEKLEDAIVGIAGIKQVFSYSRDSVSSVVILFDLDVNLEDASNQVREQVGTVRRDLPREAEEPSVTRMDINAAPVMTYTLSGDMPPRELRHYAEDVIAPQLEQVRGVASVRVRGGAERQVNVLLDLEAIQSRGITSQQIVDRIRMENLNVPGGDYDEGARQVTVRTVGEITSIADLRNLVIGTTTEGDNIRLSDVARVEDGVEDRDMIVRSDAAPAVVLDILKGSGQNSVEIARQVRQKLGGMRMAENVHANLIIDTSDFILENAHEVETALIFGGAMAILVILLFMLDLRSTLISAIALPTSVIGTFSLMYALGYSMNMMTLLGLSLAIGLLIDDSIVVRENIVKHLERGKEPTQAAIDGTREITLAVLATTATLCAVFVPVAFTSGIVGQFFKQFGITIAGATVLSAFVAFTVDPMLSARFAKQRIEGEVDRFAWVKAPFLAVFHQMDAVYLAILKWIVARRRNMVAVVVAAIGLFVLSGVLAGIMGSEFVTLEDRGRFDVIIELPAGTSLEETSRRTLIAEQEMERDPRIVTVYSTVGSDGDPNVTTWRVVCVPKWDRNEGLLEMEEIVRARILQHMPSAKISMMLPGIAEGGRNYPIALYVRGSDYESLERAAYQVRGVMAGIPGISDLNVDYAAGKPELQLAVNRDRAAALGVPTAVIAGTVRTALEGEVAGLYRDGDEEIDIRVRLDREDRDNAELIGLLTVPIMSGNQYVGYLPIREVTQQIRAEGPAVIERMDRERAIKVTASTRGRPLGDVVTEMLATLEHTQLPPGVTYKLEGDAKMMLESNESMGLALSLAIVFIYIVLASQFESFVHPITIMMALPLAMVGAMIAIFVTGWAMSMGIMIGIMLLMGLVTKNGILLVDHAVVAVREGKTPAEAVLEAGPARLRPILMTSAAMVLGMLPTALSNGSGSEFRGPMAVGIIGGVISSTFLTLLVTPVFFLFMEWLTGLFQRVRGRVPARPTGEVPGASPAE